jgi:hypothetical protein
MPSEKNIHFLKLELGQIISDLFNYYLHLNINEKPYEELPSILVEDLPLNFSIHRLTYPRKQIGPNPVRYTYFILNDERTLIIK